MKSRFGKTVEAGLADAGAQHKGGIEKTVAKKQPLLPTQKWNFGFRFFRQIETFGLDKVAPTWAASLFERLAALGAMEIERCLLDSTNASALRLHGINWKQQNIPLKHADLNWVDAVYLNNPEEYEIMQFSVSTALGRVVGFFDEAHVFQIVLLDPLHNIQPSKKYDYKVDPCGPLACEISGLKVDVRNLARECEGNNCQHAKAIRERLDSGKPVNRNPVLLITVDDTEILKQVDGAISQGASYDDILNYGLLGLIDSK